ncbi:amino acid permease, putative [Coriobacterium glomerans PW2]|uniref:Amino acid permease, putative n=1 Tax=Coriobacterium glomerans (strain ATCC 49209 / DSM 20642 / JCM 10262 / PW2) TaxID=700015 RepID=F2N9I1_CORGP|nr:hypothetical protein [Coriobacterium glomerans]AEB07010.1 amino acid permease, putative [Coriobacterium glomerans PW2]
MQLTATSELGNYMPKALILPVFAVVIAAGEYMFYRNPCPPWLLLVLGVDLLAALSLVFNML